MRRRIDETGTKEATIQQVGADRILVQLPGVSDPEHVKEILGKTAKMTFQMVDTNASIEDARKGHVPPGDVLLAAESARPGLPEAYVVRRRVMVSGDTLTDAQPTFNNAAHRSSASNSTRSARGALPMPRARMSASPSPSCSTTR